MIGGTVLGRIAKGSPETASHMLFEIRPAGRGAPRVDPKPILDGWKLLESTAIYRAAKKNPFVGEDARNPSIGQILLMSKDTLIQRVISNPRIQIYGCGKADIRSGQIDRRVLATLEYLASSGLKPTVSSLRCGHGLMTPPATSPSTPPAPRWTSPRSTASRSWATRAPARSPTSRSSAS